MFSPVVISLKDQRLSWRTDTHRLQYVVSTAAKGAGELRDSEKTPRGWHIIRAKIGHNAAWGTVFRARRPTGERYSTALAAQYPHRDWILTRILWLSGLEKGKNRLGAVDTMQRYIYIHGTHEEAALGTPCSRGCIRMGNTDIMSLFEAVPVGTPVLITESSLDEALRACAKPYPFDTLTGCFRNP